MLEERDNIEANGPPAATAPDASSLKRPAEVPLEELHASQTVLPQESTNLESESITEVGPNGNKEAHAPKRVRIEEPKPELMNEPMKKADDAPKVDSRDKVRGIAMVKAE